MATTAALTAEVQPEEVGLDSERLARLDAYLDGFVADGRQKGSLHGHHPRRADRRTSRTAGSATPRPACRSSPTRSGASTR